LYPENAYVNYIAAKHFYESDNINTALEYAARSFDIDSENPNTIFLLSMIYFSMEKYDLAVKLIENSLNISRSNPEIWYLLGEVYSKLGNIDKSIYCYATAIRYSSQYELPRIALENTIIENKPIDDPVRTKYADYHFYKGIEYIDRNYSIQARNEFRRGLLIDPHSNKGKKLYAGLIKTEGYLNKYLSLLKSIASETPDDTNLADEVEIYQSIISDTVSEDWNIDQFLIDVPKYNIELFLNKSGIPYNTYNEGFHLGSYLIHILHGYENIESSFNIIPSDFSNAFRTAREKGSDYFIMFDFRDTKRSFSANASIYHSGTGTLLQEIPVFRTGNQKISLSLQTLSGILSESLPGWSKIIKRKFNRVLLNVGNIQGTTPGDIFLVIREDDFYLKKDSLGLDFNPELLLGEVEITKTDDLVSEGILKKYHFFDLIKSGDYLIKKTESMDLSEINKNSGNQNLPLDLYKSIISIP
ncbi:MAG: tetratricopeptide repeat protein, partial [Spirochaetales bacterium]|nr:tetratricopeptide repeat protein [Spirochaetales bacterium]